MDGNVGKKKAAVLFCFKRWSINFEALDECPERSAGQTDSRDERAHVLRPRFSFLFECSAAAESGSSARKRFAAVSAAAVSGYSGVRGPEGSAVSGRWLLLLVVVELRRGATALLCSCTAGQRKRPN